MQLALQETDATLAPKPTTEMEQPALSAPQSDRLVFNAAALRLALFAQRDTHSQLANSVLLATVEQAAPPATLGTLGLLAQIVLMDII